MGSERERERLGFWGRFKRRGEERRRGRGPLVENEGLVLSGQGEGLNYDQKIK